MKLKPPTKTELLRKRLLIAVIIQAIIQATKNIANIIQYVADNPEEMIKLIIITISLTVIIVVHKIKHYDFGRIFILEIIEVLLMLTAIFCCIFVSDEGKFVDVRSLSIPEKLYRFHIVMGMISSYAISNIIYSSLRREINKRKGGDKDKKDSNKDITPNESGPIPPLEVY